MPSCPRNYSHFSTGGNHDVEVACLLMCERLDSQFFPNQGIAWGRKSIKPTGRKRFIDHQQQKLTLIVPAIFINQLTRLISFTFENKKMFARRAVQLVRVAAQRKVGKLISSQ